MELLQTSTIQCPYCGEDIEILVDTSIGEQEYVEDCQVCCRPMVITMSFANTGDMDINIRQENA